MNIMMMLIKKNAVEKLEKYQKKRYFEKDVLRKQIRNLYV